MHSKVKGAQINLRHFVSIMSVNLNGRVFEIGLLSDWLKMLCYVKLFFFCIFYFFAVYQKGSGSG